MKQTVTIGVANEGQINVSTDTMSNWQPKKVSYLGTSVFFQVDDVFYSMERKDFEEIFEARTYNFKK